MNFCLRIKGKQNKRWKIRPCIQDIVSWIQPHLKLKPLNFWIVQPISFSLFLFFFESFLFFFNWPICMDAQSLSRVWLFATPMDCSLPGSSVHGIPQARILEWAASPFSRDLPDPGIEPRSPALQADSLLSEPPGFPSRAQTHVLCISRWILNHWTTAEVPGFSLEREGIVSV